ncbi:hypothetical protein CANARDRAFT_209231 [[Candida] arabinofermentans NRRL YB-2248]|uniref:Phospholipid/glycerol acyltransferase domain-containing protein n=1 Tax=[Candida] arabinofermentans NRRL YB-2248 TaxID=983967 RepID=A0A1E4SUX0_9ASCO|nr:hypothetical protein CANARDRAFT_209231 [[Candida] arabinofermentans NRRL YB-2248]
MRSELSDHIGVNTLITGDYNQLQFWKTLGFCLLLSIYFIIYEIFKIVTYLMKYIMPLQRLDYKRFFTTGFWMLCIYILELNGVEIEIIGDQLEVEDALIISNHCSLVDYIIFPYLILESTKDKQAIQEDLSTINLPRLNFFTWFSIWDIPNFRLFRNIYQSDENWELNDDTLQITFNKFLDSNERFVEWLITFPEVNIFSLKDWKLQKSLNEKYYLPNLNNLLYPRYSSFKNVINGLYGSQFTRLYDITIIYYTKNELGEIQFKNPNILEIFGLSDDKYSIKIHIKAKLMSRLYINKTRLDKWLENKWVKKDKLITTLKNDILKNNITK